MIRISLLAAVVAVALALTGAPSAQGNKVPKLVGTVGPGFTITLKDAAGKKVTSLKAGTYSITVTDKSGIHNFVLEGPGLGPKGKGSLEVTEVSFSGKRTRGVTFRKGKTYTYVCTPHRAVMKGTFKAT